MTKTAYVVIFTIIFILSVTAGVLFYRPATSANPSDGVSPDEAKIKIKSQEIFLGKLRPGQRVSKKMLVENLSSKAIIVARMETSCTCITITPCPARIEPHDSTEFTVEYDPFEEPDFRGRLSIEYSAKDDGGNILFLGHIGVEVAEPPRQSPSRGG